MTPPVADFAARVQVGTAVGTAVGTFPTAIALGLAIGLFDGQFAVAATINVMVSAMFLSSLFVPLAGLVISRVGIGKEAK